MFSDVVRVVVVAAVALGLCFLIEHLVPREKVPWRSRVAGSVFSITLAASSPLVAWAVGFLWWPLGIVPPLPPVEQWAGPFALPVTLVFLDFLKYWEHRFEHRFFWSVHRVHHTPTELHAANGYGHPLQVIPMFIFFAIPLSLLNFSSVETPLYAGITIAFLAAFIHSPVDFHAGPLRLVLVDNRYHRIHHSLEPRHFDKNFGITLSIWDRLFGTAYDPADSEWPKVGVEGVKPPATMKEYLLHPFSRLASR